jgi:hypothetical protein
MATIECLGAWPTRDEILAGDVRPMSMSVHFENPHESEQVAILLATYIQEGPKQKKSWVARYYCPNWPNPIRDIYFTDAVRRELALRPDPPRFVTFEKCEKINKDIYYKVIFSNEIQHPRESILKNIPENVWSLAQEQHVPYNPEMDE